MKKENIIVIIPARGGSKGIIRKNLKKINGKPLLAYPIEAALKIKEIDRIIVSTEDEEISNTAKEFGAEVPFIRPKELSGDRVLTVTVLQHAIEWLKEYENYETEIVILLYATSPMITSDKIREGIGKIRNKKDVDSVVSVCKDDKYHWKEEHGKLKRHYPLEVKPRQMMIPLLRENGALYIVRKETMIKTKRYIGGNIEYILMNEKDSWDIDTEDDLEIIGNLMKKEKN
jgi:CMP-N-acetylneuraminic acid synthetase